MSQVKVGAIERAIDRMFPTVRAEDWDRNGLLVGDPDAVVTGVVLALDPTVAAIEQTVAAGANVLVTHHPAFLKAPQWMTPGRGAAGVVFSAVSNGVALINAHTNLDRDARAQMLLPQMLGYEPIKPVERSVMPTALVTVYVPASASQKVVSAMQGAGAGRIGDYEGCDFRVAGESRFSVPAHGHPAIGEPGADTVTEETRIEMVCEPGRAKGVVSAAASAHPYEEPLITVTQVAIARNAARMGMVCTVPGATTLSQLVDHAAQVCGVTPRVWGDPDTPIQRVATGTGSAGSLIGDALAADCTALVAGEVRYHDALDAVAAGLCVVELGHDVTEWPLVDLLQEAVVSVEGLSPDAVKRLPADPGWWTP